MTQNEFNPYVGPRPFERKEEDVRRFFGRSQETQEIVSYIFGHPITLVYAQSGAGKTSLFNASIASTLEKKGFDILPLTRVGGVVPQGVAVQEIKNLYIFNALLKISPESDPRAYSSKSLSEFLEMRVRMQGQDGRPRPRAIVFDQFEELFTHTPEDWREQRKGFFAQVVEALNTDPLLRVVFVIREDYLAELDPYARDLPERLRIRYRLERLAENAALHAIKDPIADTPRRFAPGVAEGLVKQLLVIRTLDATSRMAEIEGQYVEPVQLQVVCVTLWSALEPDVIEIQQAHLKNFNVNDALSNFYKSAVESAVKETGAQEAELRNWFGKTLITPMGTRNTVFRGKDSTGGIENSAVDFLEARHIIRAEFRAGARWCELTHDSLVKPIITDNEKWFADNVSIFQQQAALWASNGRPEGMLLRGRELELAEQEQRKKESESRTIQRIEQDFLAACLKLRDRERRERRGNLLLRILAVGMAIALVATFYFAYRTNEAQQETFQANATNTSQAAMVETAQTAIGGLQQESEQRSALEKANELADQARASLGNLKSRTLGRLLAVEAYLTNEGGGRIQPAVYQALFESAGLGSDILVGGGSFLFGAFTPDLNTDWVIVDNTLWNIKEIQRYSLVDSGKVVQGTFRLDGNVVIVVDNTSSLSGDRSPYLAYVKDTKNQTLEQFPITLPELGYVATDIDLSDDGTSALLGYGLKPNSSILPAISTGGIQLWDIQNLASGPKRLSVQDSSKVMAVALAHDGKKFAVVDGLKRVYFWTNDEEDTFQFYGTNALKYDTTLEYDFINGVYSGSSGRGLQFSPDDNWLAVLTKRSIQIYNITNAFKLQTRIPVPSFTIVMGYLFSLDNKSLIYGTNDYSECRDFFYSYLSNYEYLSFDDYYAYSDYYNCNPVTSIYRLSLSDPNAKPSQIFKENSSEITAMNVSKSGRLAIGDEAGYIQVADLTEDLQPYEATNVHDGRVLNILIGPDNRTVLSAGQNDGAKLWKITGGQIAITSTRTYNTTTQVMRNKNQDSDSLIIGGFNTLRDMAVIQVYPIVQNSAGPSELSFDYNENGSLDALALNQDWVIAGRTDQAYFSGSVSYFLDFWNRQSTVSDTMPITFKVNSKVSSLAFNKSGTLLAIATARGELWLDSLTNLEGRAITSTPTPVGTTGESALITPEFFPEKKIDMSQLDTTLRDIRSLDFARDDNYLIVAGTTGVGLWDLANLKGSDLQDAIYPVRISRDQKWLATSTLSGAIRLYDLENIHSSPVVLPNKIPVTQFAFSDDGNWLAVAINTGKVLVYGLPVSGYPISPVYTLNTGISVESQFEFSPSQSVGKWLVASGGAFVYLWNMEKPRDDPVVLQGHSGMVMYAGFTDDGTQIITAAADQTLRFWSMDPQKLANAACAYAGRNFYPDEWKEYFTDRPRETCIGFGYGLLPEETGVEYSPTPEATMRPMLSLMTSTPTLTLTPVFTSTPVGSFIVYVIKDGDTLGSIAVKFGVDLNTLIQDNNIANPNIIIPGNTLKIRTKNPPGSP